MPMSEWLKVMLEEIARKQAEQHAAALETERRGLEPCEHRVEKAEQSRGNGKANPDPAL